MIRERHPTVAAAIVGSLERSVDMTPTLASVARARHHLSGVEGFEPPSWEALVQGARPPEREPDDFEPGQQGQNCSSEAAATLAEHEQAMLRSQSGPLAGTPFAAAPSTWLTRVDSHLFRVLLSRRLRLPLPFSSRLCQCGRSLDVFGHHRAACSRAGVLGRRGFPVESVAVRICREPTSWSEIWILGRPTSLTAGGLKWLPTGCLCLEACSWPWTPRWCLLCIVTARLDVTQPMLMELFWGGNVPRIGGTSGPSSFGCLVRRDQGVLEPVGQSQSTFGNSSDAETCGTGMENALGRNVGLRSGSCFCHFLAEPAFGRRRRWGGPHHPGGGERGPLRGFERVTGSRCFVFNFARFG